MTRLIRIELCDECPHVAGSRSCRASQWCDEGGILRCRKFTDFPLIPDWCPLEQSGPDWKPSATVDRFGPPRCTGETGHCHPGAASSKAGGSLRCGPNPRIGSRRDQTDMSPMSPLSGPDITSRRPVYLAHHRTTNEPQNLERSQ